MTPEKIDDPNALAEMKKFFERYEKALNGNDVPVLEELFWDDPRTIRYGVGENLYGMDDIRAFRRVRPAFSLARDLERTSITTYGPDVATANTMFSRNDLAGSVGRQSQTWVRFPDGWRVVAAHVSIIGR